MVTRTRPIGSAALAFAVIIYCWVPLRLFQSAFHASNLPIETSVAAVQGHSDSLIDAIRCVGSNDTFHRFLRKTVQERMNHTQWINAEIRKIIPANLKQHCWLGFCGPWTEDIWIAMASENYSTFEPFIPVFVPWVRMWVNFIHSYVRWCTQIFALMSDDYFYVTVSMNDDGVEGGDRKQSLPENLLVFSGGGKGHIPITIAMEEHNPKDYPVTEHFEYDVMFAGSRTHPVRGSMIQDFHNSLGSRFFNPSRSKWQTDFEKAKFIASPRGYGRNSFRLMEILQSGRLPIYIYNDIVWLPYYDSINWSRFSIVVHYTEINKTIERVKTTTDADVVRMRKLVANLYETHFSMKALFNQIQLFLSHGFAKSDLRCAKYSDIRG